MPFVRADHLLPVPERDALGERRMIPCRFPPCPSALNPSLGFANEKSRNAHEHRFHNEFRDNFNDEKKRGRRLRCAIYARVSTDQGEQDPEQQLAVLRREVHAREYELAWEGFDMVTGDSHVWERKSGRDLWDLVKHGKVDVVMTYDASRLSRQHPVSVFKLLETMRRYGVYFVSATEKHFDFTEENEFREVIIFMTSWMNNWFLRNLSRSTRRGKEAAIRDGRKQGAHRKGCGKLFPCPTGAHDATGRNIRAKPKAAPRKSYSQEMVPPISAVPAGGNGTSEIGGEE